MGSWGQILQISWFSTTKKNISSTLIWLRSHCQFGPIETKLTVASQILSVWTCSRSQACILLPVTIARSIKLKSYHFWYGKCPIKQMSSSIKSSLTTSSFYILVESGTFTPNLLEQLQWRTVTENNRAMSDCNHIKDSNTGLATVFCCCVNVAYESTSRNNKMICFQRDSSAHLNYVQSINPTQLCSNKYEIRQKLWEL